MEEVLDKNTICRKWAIIIATKYPVDDPMLRRSINNFTRIAIETYFLMVYPYWEYHLGSHTINNVNSGIMKIYNEESVNMSFFNGILNSLMALPELLGKLYSGKQEGKKKDWFYQNKGFSIILEGSYIPVEGKPSLKESDMWTPFVRKLKGILRHEYAHSGFAEPGQAMGFYECPGLFSIEPSNNYNAVINMYWLPLLYWDALFDYIIKLKHGSKDSKIAKDFLYWWVGHLAKDNS